MNVTRSICQLQLYICMCLQKTKAIILTMASMRHCFKTVCKNKNICCYTCGVAVNQKQAYYHTSLPNTPRNRHTQAGLLELNSKKTSLTLTRSQRWYSTRNLIWTENGETLIRSPHKDVYVPPVSFAEYIMSKLDEYKELEVLVSNFL